MSFNVQSRAVSSSAIQASDGVAVSMAIASRVRGSARTCTLVATGPTTRLRRSTSGLELGFDAVERLADHLVRRTLDQAGPNACKRPADQHVGRPVHDRPAGRSILEGHRRGCVDGAAGRLAAGLDDCPARLVSLGDVHVDVEPGTDEANSNLGFCLEMGLVDNL